jgi:hypothetical protein
VTISKAQLTQSSVLRCYEKNIFLRSSTAFSVLSTEQQEKSYVDVKGEGESKAKTPSCAVLDFWLASMLVFGLREWISCLWRPTHRKSARRTSKKRRENERMMDNGRSNIHQTMKLRGRPSLCLLSSILNLLIRYNFLFSCLLLLLLGSLRFSAFNICFGGPENEDFVSLCTPWRLPQNVLINSGPKSNFLARV